MPRFDVSLGTGPELFLVLLYVQKLIGRRTRRLMGRSNWYSIFKRGASRIVY